jgi:aminopeptidase YwaD
MSQNLKEKGSVYLNKLCESIGSRRVGSPANRAATDYFESVVKEFGFETLTPSFDCLDWCQAESILTVEDRIQFNTRTSPYSRGCYAEGPVSVVSTIDELESVDARGKLLLVRGELAKEQLMPKNFTFYNPEGHKRIIGLLEAKDPLAIIAATSRNPEMAGSTYPFPLVEDGDFDIPSVYLSEEEGIRLARHAGRVGALKIHALRSPARGYNVIATRGDDRQSRVVIFAHIDTKDDTPGALDNASGIVILLLLAELLEDYSGSPGVELVALNGEDYYSNPGQQQYLEMNKDGFDEILLGINLDGVGYLEGATAYSLYELPSSISNLVDESLGPRTGLIEGEKWFQGDHGLFINRGVPALAFTSEKVEELVGSIVHTPKDRPDVVEVDKLVEVVAGLHGSIEGFNEP